MNRFVESVPIQASIEVQAGSIHAWLAQQGYTLDSVSIRSDGTILIESEDDRDFTSELATYVLEEQNAQAFREDQYQAKLEALESLDLSKATLTSLRDAFQIMRDVLLDRGQ